MRLGAWSVPEGDAAREARISRAERALSWLASSNRIGTRKILGDRLMVLLERENTEDHAIPTHPGEWKSFVFLLFVHGMAGETLDEGAATRAVREEFPETPREADEGAAAGAPHAVRRFLRTLSDEGLLRETESDRYEVTHESHRGGPVV